MHTTRTLTSLLLSGMICLLCSTTSAQSIPNRAPGQIATLSADSMLAARISRARVLSKGRISQLHSKQVELDNGQRVQIGRIAPKLFSEQDQLQRELPRASRGLFGRVVSADEGYELEDSFVLVRSTSIVVSDPGVVKQSSALYREFIAGAVNPQQVKVSDLDAGAQRQLRDFIRQEVPRLPAGHPLKAAAAQGEQPLLVALAQGQGDLEIIDTYTIPKRPPRISNGVIQAPKLINGVFQLNQTRNMTLKANLGAAKVNIPLTPVTQQETPAPSASGAVSGGGTYDFKTKLLNGWTVGHYWEWERTFKFTSGLLRVHTSAWAGLGLRIPIIVEGHVNPTRNTVNRSTDAETSFRVQFKAYTVDGDTQFYKDAGLSAGKAFRGEEFLCSVGYSYGLKLRALWTDLVNIPTTEVSLDDKCSRNFKPPHGSKLTPIKDEYFTIKQLGFKYLNGTIKGGLQLKFDGKIKAAFSAMYDNRNLQSYNKNDTSRRMSSTQNITFKDGNDQHWYVAKLPVMSSPGVKKYGFKLDALRYQTRVAITPGLRLELNAGFKWWSRRWRKTYWLDGFTLELGSLTLNRHEGTRDGVEYKGGQKLWRR